MLPEKQPGRLGTVTALRPAARWLGSALCIATVAIALAALPGTPASAQTFFSIFGGPRHAPPAPFRDDRRGNPFSDFFGSLFGERYRGDDDRKGNTFANYCVRTCDGKYFPVNRGGRGDVALDKVCHAMCPSAQTKIFSGPGIEHATAPDGQKYMSLPNALAYRTKIVDGCTCNGRDPFGVATVDLENDPTLRSGDIVVRESGIKVFTGATPPHANSEFVPIRNAPNMSPALVKQLMALKILPNNPHAPFAMTVTVRQTPPEIPEALRTTAPEIPNPNANAPAANEQPARAN